MACRVVENTHVDNTVGFICQNGALFSCSHCGAELCALHAEPCAGCYEIFCPTCLRSHQSSGADLDKRVLAERRRDDARRRWHGHA